MLPPKPIQKPAIPIYRGTFDEPAIRRAARFGHSLLKGPGRTVQMLNDTLGYYNDDAKQKGVDTSQVKHILLKRDLR